MTPRSSIHLPIVELLSSGQVVQNFSDSETSTTSPLSSTTSTEPHSLRKWRSRSSYGIRMPYPAPACSFWVPRDRILSWFLYAGIYPARHNRRACCYNGVTPRWSIRLTDSQQPFTFFRGPPARSSAFEPLWWDIFRSTGSSHPRPPVPLPDEPGVAAFADLRLPRPVDRPLLPADIAPAEFDLRPGERPVVEDPGEGLHS